MRRDVLVLGLITATLTAFVAGYRGMQFYRQPSTAPHFIAVPMPAVKLPCDSVGRSQTQVNHFKKMTGYAQGRAGYVVDHIVPLCACGKDSTVNMMWQPVDSGKLKDRWEDLMCRALLKAPKDTL